MAKKSNPSLSIILEYFEKNGFPKEPFKINEATTIINCERCVQSLVKILKANSGKKLVIPYYNHLLNIYNYLYEKK